MMTYVALSPPRLPGVPIFFTVALAQRGRRLLVEQVDHLRNAVRVTRAERPFGIDAWVVGHGGRI